VPHALIFIAVSDRIWQALGVDETWRALGRMSRCTKVGLAHQVLLVAGLNGSRRARKRAIPARPYIDRLIVLRRLAPRLRDGVPDCGQIGKQRAGEALDSEKAAATSLVDPRHEQGRVSPSKHGSELHRHPPHPDEVVRGRFQNGDLDRLTRGQHASGPDAESSGDDGRDQMPGRWIDRLGYRGRKFRSPLILNLSIRTFAPPGTGRVTILAGPRLS